MVLIFVGCIICEMHNLAMQRVVPWMFCLKLCHMDILNHVLKPQSGLSGYLILVEFQARSDFISPPPVCIGVLLSVLGYVCRIGNLL